MMKSTEAIRSVLQYRPVALGILVAAAGLTGCGGGGGGGGGAGSTTPQTGSPTLPSLATYSYGNFKQIGLTPQNLPAGYANARAYGNFNGRSLGFFRAVETYSTAQPINNATPSRFEFYDRLSNGTYALNKDLLADQNGCLHPRKALVADFNGDGRPDIFVACHGYDAAPFPGERNKVVLSQPNGTYATSDASTDTGFFHGASAADVNGDGRIDVIAVGSYDSQRVIALLNDGSGKFTRDTNEARLPKLGNRNYYSVELIDVDDDSRLDLVLGGHEWENAPTQYYTNPGDFMFGSATPVTIPAVANEGVVLDFTVTGSDANRTLWVLRTSGGDGTFYQSRVVQKVNVQTLNSTLALNQRPQTWIPWIIPSVASNSRNVITSDNLADQLEITQ